MNNNSDQFKNILIRLPAQLLSQLKEHKFWLGIIIIYSISAINSIGHYHLDEHYQILEFTGWKLGLGSSLPWEFEAQIRPAFQPALAVVIYKLVELFPGTVDHFNFVMLLRIISTSLFLTSIFWIIRWTKDLVSDNPKYQKWYVMSLSLFWFFPFTQIRFSSESWATTLFTLGMAYFLKISNEPKWADRNRSLDSSKNLSDHSLNYFWVGVLFGASFLFRFQMGLAISGMMLWWLVFHHRRIDFWKKYFSLASGVILLIGLGILVDRWFYGEWVFTSFNYFWVNLVEDKASEYGRDSIWFYFDHANRYLIPPYSVMIIGLILSCFYFFYKHVVVWAVGFFLLAHFAIPHKEIRFLIPITLLLPMMVLMAWQRWIVLLPKLKMLEHRYLIRFLISVNFLLLIVVILRPADDLTLLSKVSYRFNDGKPYTMIVGTTHRGPPFNGIFYEPENLEIINLAEGGDLVEQIGQTVDNNIKLVWNIFPAYKPILVYLEEPFEVDTDKFKSVPLYQIPSVHLRKINFYNWIEKSKLKTKYLYKIVPKNLIKQLQKKGN